MTDGLLKTEIRDNAVYDLETDYGNFQKGYMNLKKVHGILKWIVEQTRRSRMAYRQIQLS